jgi:hypothetical protein
VPYLGLAGVMAARAAFRRSSPRPNSDGSHPRLPNQALTLCPSPRGGRVGERVALEGWGEGRFGGLGRGSLWGAPPVDSLRSVRRLVSAFAGGLGRPPPTERAAQGVRGDASRRSVRAESFLRLPGKAAAVMVLPSTAAGSAGLARPRRCRRKVARDSPPERSAKRPSPQPSPPPGGGTEGEGLVGVAGPPKATLSPTLPHWGRDRG